MTIIGESIVSPAPSDHCVYWPTFRIIFAVALEFAVAIAFYPALRLGRHVRMVLLVAALATICGSVWLIPVEVRVARGIDGLLCVGLMVSLFDLDQFTWRGGRISFGEFLVYLVNDMWLVRARVPAEMRLSPGDNTRLLARRAAGLLVALVFGIAVFRFDWLAWPFWMEHAAKVVAIYLVLVLGTNGAAAAWRLMGATGLDPFGWAITARTPAEFWRSWNRPAGQFLNEYVFLPAGGRHRAIRATLATFVVSAVIHEGLFSVVLGAVQGFQFAFFVLNGLAVVATLRLRPRGWRGVVFMAFTFCFELATSVLFFASVNHVVRIYVHPLPGWLGVWDRATWHH